MEELKITTEELKELLTVVFNRHNANFSQRGDEYHDDYDISYKVVIDDIIYKIKNGSLLMK